MDLPRDFITWHYAIALPQFIKRKKESFAATLNFFDILFLLKNLFAPYRRLTVTSQNATLGVYSFLDKLSFNLISRIIGAFVRFFLIIVGVIAIIITTLLDILIVLLYMTVPVFTFQKYWNYLRNTFTEKDYASAQKLTEKITETNLFKKVSLFFEIDFTTIFHDATGLNVSKVKQLENPAQILITLSKNWPNLADFLAKVNIKPNYFESLVNYLDANDNLTSPKPKPIGQILSFGYTRNLDKFSSKVKSKNFRLTKSQKDIIVTIEKVLTREQNNNILLVGEPGVGRHTIVEHLAAEIASSNLPNLSAYQVVVLDAIALAGTGKNLVAVKSNFEAVLSEAQFAGNIILILDQIDRIITAQDGRVDLTEVISTTLKDGSLPTIGITTIDDFNQYIRTNTNLLKFFEKIDIAKLEDDEVLTLLIDKVLEIYSKQTLSATLYSLLEIIEKTNQLIPDKAQPEKALLLFEDCMTEAKARKLNQINTRLVDEVLKIKTKIPLGEITKSEAEKLKKLETLLHKRIIGQDEAINELSQAMRRARADIDRSPRPIGSFLFLGPTGVGKTETAKALASTYFGGASDNTADDKMVRLDMSEYQSQDALTRLIGNNQTKTPGILANLIRENPFGLLLVDEFEKADHAVHNLFLQILDEGYLTDAFGKKVSFDNIIIIATSNAAAEFIREQLTMPDMARILLASKGESLSKKLVDYVLEKGLFSPELINRFDAVIVYHPLTQEQIAQVSTILLTDLAARLRETKNITLEITPQLAQRVAQKGFDPTFGARPIRRLITDKIEDNIAKMIIDGTLKNGDKIASADLVKFLAS